MFQVYEFLISDDFLKEFPFITRKLKKIQLKYNFAGFTSENGYGETDDNITDDDDLNDSSQKPIMTSSFQSKPTTNGGDWRSNHYSGSSSLSSFSYSPRSNNSSVSSHGKKQTIPAALPRITQDGSLKSNTSQPDKLSSDSH